MIQSELWHDTILDAIGAAVQAAGGIKKVSGQIWPALDGSSAASKLRSALSSASAQKLCPLEVVLIGTLAKEAGDSSIMDFLGRVWGFEIKSLSPAATKKRAKRARKKALLKELQLLEDEDDDDSEDEE